jgi:hypothetical protein
MSDEEYASRARSYYQDFLPSRYQQIPNPEHFFTDLGQRIENQVQTTERALAGPDSPDEGFLQKVGRLNMARLRAGELVMAQEVYSIPPEIEQETEPDEESAKTTAMVGLLNNWQQAMWAMNDEAENTPTPPRR